MARNITDKYRLPKHPVENMAALTSFKAQNSITGV